MNSLKDMAEKLVNSNDEFVMSDEFTELCARYIAGGGDINIKNLNNETILMKAVKFATGAAVRLIIDAGVDIDAKDLKGNSALMLLSDIPADLAVYMRLLIDAGANIDAKNNQGETALMLASANGNRNAVVELIKAEADVNARDDKGKTVLEHAFSGQQKRVIKALIKAGADVNATNNQGETVLLRGPWWEWWEWWDDAVKVFIKAGADVNAKNKDGKTAFDLANEGGYEKIADVLWAKMHGHVVKRKCALVEIAQDEYSF